MLKGIKKILILLPITDISRYEVVFGGKSRFGVCLLNKVQLRHEVLAKTFILGVDFVGTDSYTTIFGDSIYCGNVFDKKFKAAKENDEKDSRDTIFGYYVMNSERFGVVALNKKNEVDNKY